MRLSQGDEHALRTVVEYYSHKWLRHTIHLTGSREDALDVLQEVFLKLWLNRTTLPGIENPEAWLYTVLSNTASNFIRSKLRYELNIKNIAGSVMEIEDGNADIERRFTKSLVDEAIDHLPAKRKEVFLLSRRDGLNRKQIAEQLNISEHTVRNQLNEAISFIRNYLERKGTLAIPAAIILGLINN